MGIYSNTWRRSYMQQALEEFEWVYVCQQEGCRKWTSRAERPPRPPLCCNRERLAEIADGELACEWYAMCANAADGLADHPVMPPVPTCRRCADRHQLTMHEPA